MLVEGESDRVALHTLALGTGRDLRAHNVEVVSMDGITNIRALALRFGPHGDDVRLAGLFDAPEEDVVRRGLVAAGVLGDPDGDLRAVGFFGCTRDLEDELIRAHGVHGAQSVIEADGEGRSLRLLAQMPAQAGWSHVQLLRRFMGSQSGRKARYAELLVAALEPDDVPAPLRSLLEWIAEPW